MNKQTAVIGFPIKHSVSPQIHNYWITKYNLNIDKYKKIPVVPKNLSDFLQQCKEEQYRGLNITIPHKQNAFELCDSVSIDAAALKAVNTITFDDDKIIGDNTDAEGFHNSISKELIKTNIKNQKTIVLGAGGSARSVIMILNTMGSEIVVANRTPQNAEKIKDDLALNFQTCLLSEVTTHLRGCKFIVNTTNLGMENSKNNLINFDKVEDDTYVYDLIYNPIKTNFLEIAESKGMKNQNGLSMLMHQAAASFKIWHGVYPSIDLGLAQALEVR